MATVRQEILTTMKKGLTEAKKYNDVLYVAQESGKSLMTDEQATQLANLVTEQGETIADSDITAAVATVYPGVTLPQGE